MTSFRMAAKISQNLVAIWQSTSLCYLLFFNGLCNCHFFVIFHDDAIKWKHFPRNWPYVQKIHWSPANSPHKGQWCGPLMFYLICAWINNWVNDREAGDLRCHPAHYDVIVMLLCLCVLVFSLIIILCVIYCVFVYCFMSVHCFCVDHHRGFHNIHNETQGRH